MTDADMFSDPLNDCGCCARRAALTPAPTRNRGGLDTIAYRVGDHAQFRETMLARLSADDLPALAELRTRDDSDFTIALIDAWAAVADVLTFYQEQIANESFLRTAKERLSVLELSRLVGYRLHPGVAAGVDLAFTINEDPDTTIIDAGVRVQSVPGPGEKPQSFETIEKIEARAAWNSMRPRMGRRHPVTDKTTTLYFDGTGTNLQPGDGLLLLPDDGGSPIFRQVASADAETKARRTKVELFGRETMIIPVMTLVRESPSAAAPSTAGSRSLSDSPSAISPGIAATMREATAQRTIDGKNVSAAAWTFADRKISGSQLNSMALLLNLNVIDLFNNLNATAPPPPGVVVFRTRASIFGHNAPKWQALPNSQRFGEMHIKKAGEAATYVVGAYANREHSWADGTLAGYHNAGGPNHIYLDNSHPKIVENGWVVLKDRGVVRSYRVREVVEMSRSDFGLSNKVTRLTLNSNRDLNLFSIRTTVVYAQSEELALAPLPISTPVQGESVELDGFIDGLSKGRRVIVCGEPVDDAGNRRCESAIIEDIEHETGIDGFTRLIFRKPLQSYERSTVTIHANVARATHGETVQEVMGSGNAAVPWTLFNLRQTPLTWTSAATPTGTASTLQIRVNDLLWQETASLFEHGPADRVFVTHTADDGTTQVRFGDGLTGARPPSGQDNIRATYRKGIGLDGLVRAEQLSLLLSRPLGVKEVINPLPSAGADDPEQLTDARRNAPLTVLTMDRIVSLRDYEDFARSFAGVAKALAGWTSDGYSRGVFVTIAGPNGAAIETDGTTMKNLLDAIRLAGDPLVPVRVKTYRRALFSIEAGIQVSPEYRPDSVLRAARARLSRQFSFAERSFGQPVILSQVIAVLQAVPGVMAVDVDALYRTDEERDRNERLPAAVPAPGVTGEPQAAELLTLHPDSLNDVKVVA